MNPTVNRILHIIGIAVAVAVPVLTAVLTGLPATSKAAVIVAAVLGILSTLKGAFGTPDATATVTSASKGTADLLVTAGATPKKGDVVKIDPQTRPGSGYDKGSAGLVQLLILAIIAAAMVTLLALPARAQSPSPQAIGCIDKANSYCVVPAAAVGWQINLKTGKTANAVGLLGLTLQHSFGTLPLGLGLYGGLGASEDNQGSYQGCLGISITSWGLLCGGAQHASFVGGSTAWQGMLTFAGQLTSGGTPSYMRATAGNARLAGEADGMLKARAEAGAK
jgi:hypothetical protein